MALGIRQHATVFMAHCKEIFIARVCISTRIARGSAFIYLLISPAVVLHFPCCGVCTGAIMGQVWRLAAHIHYSVVAIHPLALTMGHTQEVVACEKQLTIDLAGVECAIRTIVPHSVGGIKAIVAAYAFHPIFFIWSFSSVLRIDRYAPKRLTIYLNGVHRVGSDSTPEYTTADSPRASEKS